MNLRELAAAVERPGCPMDLARVAAEVIREYARLLEERSEENGET